VIALPHVSAAPARTCRRLFIDNDAKKRWPGARKTGLGFFHSSRFVIL